MAVRNEAVRLSLQDDFTSKMARAAAATKLLEQNLNSLSRSAIGIDRDFARHEKTVQGLGESSERSGKQIDKLSGRLALLAQAASVLGPALIPLGAPLVGVMAGLTAQLGSVAGAVGVAVLAFSGLGDGMKALDEYQLEPTAENLQKMRIEMEKLGPAGADFARFIDGLGPELKTLQLAARDGLFPGLEDGITNLMPMLPRVRDIITDISTAMGGLASDAGADLAGPEWASFFDYLDSEAGPILTEFGQTVGNFAQGFAGLLVGLGPLTNDFSGGLLGMAEAFAEWSAGLAGNNSFQEFLDYVRESGPMAVDALGQIAVTFAQIIAAAAPVGDAILPVLTQMLELIGDLAASPLGTLFFTAAAGLSVYSRAAALAASATTRLAAAQKAGAGAGKQMNAGLASLRANAPQVAAGLGMVALASTELDNKANLSNTAMLALAGSFAGPWGAAAGAAIGLTMDLASANDDLATAIKEANEASRSGTRDEQEEKYEKLRANIEDTQSAMDNFWSMDYGDRGLAERIGDDVQAIGGWMSGMVGKGKTTLEQYEAGLGDVDFTTRQLADALGMTAQQFAVASGNAESFTGALARMAGFLDKRGALREYREEIKNFSDALKDGFQPKNTQGLDRYAGSILKVAASIQTLPAREKFLKGAQEQLLEFAKTGPKAERAVGKIMDRFVALGLMPPIKPKVDADTKPADDKLRSTGTKLDALGRRRARAKVDADTGSADRKLTTTERLARELAGLPINPKVKVDTGNAMGQIASVRNALGGLRDRTVFVNVMQRGNVGPAARAAEGGFAEGGYTGKGGKYEVAGVAHRREFVFSSEATDGNEAMLDSLHRGLRGYANGGLVGGSLSLSGGGGSSGGGGDLSSSAWTSAMNMGEAFNTATASLRTLNRALKHSEKAVDSERRQRDALISRRDEVRSGIREGLGGDIWEGSGGSPWTAGASMNPTAALEQQTAEAKEFARLVNDLKGRGVDGAALMEIIGKGDIERLRLMAALPASELRRYETAYNANQQALAAAGVVGGEAVVGQQIRESNRELRALRAEVRGVQAAIKNKGKDDNRSRRENTREAARNQRRGVATAARNRPNG